MRPKTDFQQRRAKIVERHIAPRGVRSSSFSQRPSKSATRRINRSAYRTPFQVVVSEQMDRAAGTFGDAGNKDDVYRIVRGIKMMVSSDR